MTRILIFSLILLGAGCNPSSKNPLSSSPTTIHSDRLVWEERACYPNDEIRMVKVLYTANGTYILDYPVGFIGPIPDGHMREDGTQAPSSLLLGDVSNAKPAGDPTADDLKGDGDGTTVVK